MKTITKKVTYLFLVITLLFAIIPNLVSAKSFTDVNQNYWANSDINQMADSGVIDGYQDGTFKPEQNVTREEFAKILVASFGLDPILDTSSFSDVKSTRWSSPYIEAAKPFMSNYVGPTGKKMFKPFELALREDVAVSLVKALGIAPIPQNDKTLKRFRDNDHISPQLMDYVAVAVENNLISGFTDSTFRGDQPITRAQTATLLNRALKSTGDNNDIPLTITKFEPSVEDPNIIEFEGQTLPNVKVKSDDADLFIEKDGSFSGTYRFRVSGLKAIKFVATGQFGKSVSVTKTINIDIKKPTIILDDVSQVVYSPILPISGITTNAILVKVNNQIVSTNVEGKFITNVQLVEGTNNIKIEIRDAAEMATFRYLNVLYVKQKSNNSIDLPSQNNSSTDTQNLPPDIVVTSATYSSTSQYVFSGIVSPPNALLYVDNAFVSSDEGGNFSKNVDLNSDSRVINVIVKIRQNGNIVSINRSYTIMLNPN